MRIILGKMDILTWTKGERFKIYGKNTGKAVGELHKKLKICIIDGQSEKFNDRNWFDNKQVFIP